MTKKHSNYTCKQTRNSRNSTVSKQFSVAPRTSNYVPDVLNLALPPPGKLAKIKNRRTKSSNKRSSSEANLKDKEDDNVSEEEIYDDEDNDQEVLPNERPVCEDFGEYEHVILAPAKQLQKCSLCGQVGHKRNRCDSITMKNRLESVASLLSLHKASPVTPDMIAKLRGIQQIRPSHMPQEVPFPVDAEAPIGKKYFHLKEVGSSHVGGVVHGAKE